MIALDRRLFAQAQAGDPVAIDRLLRQVQPDIRRYARRQCHRTSAIDDVVQEALIVVYRRVGTVRDPLALPAWLARIVARLCMLPVLALVRAGESLAQWHEADPVLDRPGDALRLDLVRGIESLPPLYREAILLRDVEELTIDEAASRLGITREACKSRIHRGRTLLREFLRPEGHGSSR